MDCFTCRYWKYLDTTKGTGECRRHPPMILPAPQMAATSHWPETNHRQGCGEWWQCTSEQIRDRNAMDDAVVRMRARRRAAKDSAKPSTPAAPEEGK